MNEAALPKITQLTVSDATRHALAVTLRGCEELIPHDEWLKKLVRAPVGRGHSPG